jgi:hypothetical protein
VSRLEGSTAGPIFLSRLAELRSVATDWEVRGLFGNEYALERAVDEIKKLSKAPQFTVLDRRNLKVVFSKDDSETKSLVKNIITIAHGWVESDAPLGVFDKKTAERKAKKLKAEEEKRKKKAKH